MARETIEHRVEILESRMDRLRHKVDDVEAGYGETVYRIGRDVLGLKINLGRVAGALDVRPASEREIDAALDEQI
ncbi:hypothetical protein [Nocardia pseudobrasiliensis]|uniref:Uncharacterized protein n=1 Tax=Nocardia pseudobrasiliensis TaxID=45979 RepID=A0A370I7E4_9NOCA|nr:hypothetical protein [Nocardia pseudobrasiliensis]RDI66638.1 hypothetical protein DFR76_104388 [Nocardia pseudobrasiliensis]